MPSSSTSSSSRYLLGFFAVLLAVVGTALAASLVLVRYAVEPADRLVRGLVLLRTATSPDAAFGDSRFVWGLIGKHDFPTIGAEGETLFDMESRVRFYYRNKDPRRVIVQGDPHAFAPYKLNRARHEYLEDPRWGFLRRFFDYHREYLLLYWERLAEDGLGAFQQQNAMRWGWVEARVSWAEVPPESRTVQARTRARLLSPGPDFATGEFAASFRRTLEALTARGASVCVLTTPVSYDFHRFSSADPHVEGARAFMERVAGEYGAQYVDYYTFYARREFDGYFKDMDHLNATGAREFTERVLSTCFGESDRTVTASH